MQGLSVSDKKTSTYLSFLYFKNKVPVRTGTLSTITRSSTAVLVAAVGVVAVAVALAGRVVALAALAVEAAVQVARAAAAPVAIIDVTDRVA
jgi:hypothetical protein